MQDSAPEVVEDEEVSEELPDDGKTTDIVEEACESAQTDEVPEDTIELQVQEGVGDAQPITTIIQVHSHLINVLTSMSM